MFYSHLIFYLDKDHVWQLAGAFVQEDFANIFWFSIINQYSDMIFKWVYYDQSLSSVVASNAPKGVEYE